MVALWTLPKEQHKGTAHVSVPATAASAPGLVAMAALWSLIWGKPITVTVILCDWLPWSNVRSEWRTTGVLSQK